jgi:hypothetical protein
LEDQERDDKMFRLVFEEYIVMVTGGWNWLRIVTKADFQVSGLEILGPSTKYILSSKEVLRNLSTLAAH